MAASATFHGSARTTRSADLAASAGDASPAPTSAARSCVALLVISRAPRTTVCECEDFRSPRARALPTVPVPMIAIFMARCSLPDANQNKRDGEQFRWLWSRPRRPGAHRRYADIWFHRIRRTRCQQRPKAGVYPQRRPQRGPLRASRRDYFMSMHRASTIATAERAAARGEPWLSLFEPAELHELLRGAGFSAIENLGASEIAERFYGVVGPDITLGPGPHIVRAATEGRIGLEAECLAQGLVMRTGSRD